MVYDNLFFSPIYMIAEIFLSFFFFFSSNLSNVKYFQQVTLHIKKLILTYESEYYCNKQSLYTQYYDQIHK